MSLKLEISVKKSMYFDIFSNSLIIFLFHNIRLKPKIK